MNWFWKIPFIERYISATEFYSAQLERDRIIKLLNDRQKAQCVNLQCNVYDWAPGHDYDCEAYGTEELIALIKGGK